MDEKWKGVWNDLVDDCRENRNSDEATVQKSWEEFLCDAGFFGYSKRNGEVRSQLSVRIGSKERVIPDIVVEKNGEKRFVVELKRYFLPFDNGFEEQLLSYLRLFQCPVGVLVCEKIFVYLYDFNSNSCKSVVIPYEKDSSNGIAFVELFSNGGFDFEKITAFVEREVRRSKDRETIRSELKKPEVVERAVREYFERENFPKDVVTQVLGEFRFDCREKSNEKALVASPGNVSYKVTDSPVKNPGTNQSKNSGGIGKFLAKSMAQSKGFPITMDYSYAHIQRATGKFWATPAPELLEKDWWIILDDDSEKKLYVFLVPKNSLTGRLFKRKNKNLIDLHIHLGDFRDTASGISFERFLKDSFNY